MEAEEEVEAVEAVESEVEPQEKRVERSCLHSSMKRSTGFRAFRRTRVRQPTP